MSAKSVLFFSACVLLLQNISTQCIGYGAEFSLVRPYSAAPLAAASPCAGSAYAAVPYAGASYTGYTAASIPSSKGGGLAVSSSSPIQPSGLSILSENSIDGALGVSGQLPFLAAVALEGSLPTAGVGNVAYACGNGNVGILSEEYDAAGYNSLAGSLGYGAGISGIAGIGYGPAGFGAAANSPAVIGNIGSAYGSGIRTGCGCGSIY